MADEPQQTPNPTATQQVVNAWQQMSAGRRTLMVMLLLATLGLMSGLIMQMRSANYQTLFSNLEEGDAQAIMDHLNTQRVPFELTRDGRTILVPAKEVSRLRVSLVAQDLPSGGDIGYNIFDEAPIGMTDFVQHQNFIRALQGELARTIRGLPMVESARVHVSLPQDTVFLSESAKPSASVVVRLLPGHVFSERMSQSIVQLISRAVPGLEPESVALIDGSNGRSMTPEGEDPRNAEMTSQERIRRNYEMERSEAIVALLEPLVGPGNVIVRVAAEFDFTEQVTSSDQIVGRGVPTQTETEVEINTNGSAMPGGVIGSDTELGEEEINNLTEEGAQINRTTRVTNEIGRSVTQQSAKGPTLQRQSASVMIHHRRVETPGETEDDPVTVSYQPWSTAELTNFEQIVKGAIGYQQLDGSGNPRDSVTVQSMAFLMPGGMDMGDDVYDQQAKRVWIMGMVRMGLLLLGALVLFFFVIRPVTKQVIKPVFLPAEDLPRNLLGQTVGAAEEQIQGGGARAGGNLPGGAAAAGALEDQANVEAEIEAPELGDEGINISIQKMTEENPDEAAQVIRNWLGDAG